MRLFSMSVKTPESSLGKFSALGGCPALIQLQLNFLEEETQPEFWELPQFLDQRFCFRNQKHLLRVRYGDWP